MGYMGLGYWCDSDGASDFRATLQDAEKKGKRAAQAVIRKEFKDRANYCNTDGFVNVALVMESAGEKTGYSGTTPDPAKYMTKQDFTTLIDGLRELIRDCGPEDMADQNTNWHRENFERMLKFVKEKARK